jgi:cell division protein FtsQ
MRRNSNSVGLRIGKKLLILLMMVGIPVFILLTSFNIETVEVVGAKEYTSEQIKEQVITSPQEHNSLYLYLKYKFFSTPQLPFIEKMNVEMNGNHAVTIYVYEKMVAGCVEFMGEYLYFDKDGIVVESSSKKLDKIPEIKGLKFSEIILNEKLKVQNVVLENQDVNVEQESKLSEKQKLLKQQEEAQKQAQEEKKRNEKLFDTIINLMQLIDKYELDIDAINFNTSDEVTVDSDGIRILLGKKSTYDEEFSEIKSIMVKAKGMDITIDMRNYVKGMENIIAKPKKATE